MCEQQNEKNPSTWSDYGFLIFKESCRKMVRLIDAIRKKAKIFSVQRWTFECSRFDQEIKAIFFAIAAAFEIFG